MGRHATQVLHHLHDLNPWLPACVALAALSSAVLLPGWIRAAHRLGWTGPDLHKADRRPVADQGGVPVLLAWAIGLGAYLAVRAFAFDGRALNPAIWAALGTVVLCAAIGVVDDALGWKRRASVSTRRRSSALWRACRCGWAPGSIRSGRRC